MMKKKDKLLLIKIKLRDTNKSSQKSLKYQAQSETTNKEFQV